VHQCQQRLQSLNDELRVTAAAYQHVAVEQTVLNAAVHRDVGFPEKIRAQHIQRCVGGHQLHDRGRVHGFASAMTEARWALAIGIDHQQGHGTGRHLRPRQRLCNAFWQARLCGQGGRASQPQQGRCGQRKQPLVRLGRKKAA